MKSNLVKQCGVLLMVLPVMVFCVLGFAHAQSEAVTLVGEINDTYQLVAGGQIYDVEQNAIGSDLTENYISVKVKVEGVVREGEELKIITVTSFQVIDE